MESPADTASIPAPDTPAIPTGTRSSPAPINSFHEVDARFCELENGVLGYHCPWCGLGIITRMGELACRIFRHGETRGRQLSPHANKERCAAARADPATVGCCNPYRIRQEGDRYVVEKCGWI